jgi:transposase
MREIVNGIFYVMRAGCPWRLLPNDWPPWGTVYRLVRRLAVAPDRFAIGHHERVVYPFKAPVVVDGSLEVFSSRRASIAREAAWVSYCKWIAGAPNRIRL